FPQLALSSHAPSRSAQAFAGTWLSPARSLKPTDLKARLLSEHDTCRKGLRRSSKRAAPTEAVFMTTNMLYKIKKPDRNGGAFLPFWEKRWYNKTELCERLVRWQFRAREKVGMHQIFGKKVLSACSRPGTL